MTALSSANGSYLYIWSGAFRTPAQQLAEASIVGSGVWLGSEELIHKRFERCESPGHKIAERASRLHGGGGPSTTKTTAIELMDMGSIMLQNCNKSNHA